MARGDRAQAREFEGREGSRWINARPTSEDFATWFNTVPMHEGMVPDRYVSGITLISAVEEIDVIEEVEGARRIPVKRSQVVYIPYPKVETRVLYYEDLMEKRRAEWVGVKEPVEVQRMPSRSEGVVPSNEGYPPGFFYAWARHDKGFTTFICYSVRVAVYERESYMAKLDGRPATPVISGHGTKQVPILRYNDRADENAMMKAETGAMGRALGMAGMLIVPGAGVATAEDMQEALAQEAHTGASPAASEPEAPSPPPADPAAEQEATEAKMRQEATALIGRLQADFPKKWEEVQAHAAERKWGKLSDLTGPALRGFLRLLERKVAEGEADQDAPDEEARDAA